MKTQRTLKIVRFWFPLVMVAVGWGTTLVAQEKPVTFLLRQNSEVGLQFADTAPFTPAPLAPPLLLKSENTALHLSLWGTLVPVALGFASTDYSPDGPEDESVAPGLLILGGVIFGPSLGYFYGGRPGRAFTGIGIRVVGTGAILVAIAASWDNPDAGGAQAAAIIGLGLMAISPIYDIATVKRAVRTHNRSLQEKALTITPTYLAQHGAPGLQLQINF